MDDTAQEIRLQEIPKEPVPFNNRYLISGLVHGFNKSWMYLVTILMLFFGYLLFQSLCVFPLMAVLIKNGYSHNEIIENASLLFDSNALQMDRNLVLVLEMGMFVFAFIGLFIGIRYIHRKTLTSVLTGFAEFRYRRFWFAFSVWSSFIVVSTVVSYFLFPGELQINFNPPGFLASTAIMFLLMPIQTGLEEVVFRGYFLQGLSQIFRNGIVPLLITSLLFGLAHMSNPEVKQFGWPVMLTYYTCFALFMGSLTLLDEGLELAFGIHFANNIISSMLLCSPNSVVKTYSVFEVLHEDPSSEILAWLVMASLAFLIFWLKYRWKNFKLIIK